MVLRTVMLLIHVRGLNEMQSQKIICGYDKDQPSCRHASYIFSGDFISPRHHYTVIMLTVLLFGS